MSTIAAGTTLTTALVNTGDTSGQLVFQTNGTTTAMTIGTNQVVSLAQPLPVASGGTGATSLSGITAGSATNLAGGGAGQVPYNTGAGATSFVSAGSSGQAFLSNGSSAPSWGTLGVGAGGTGATTLTANNVILGNGASAVQFVAPGSNGNVLTSNGTTWQSTAPVAGGTTTFTASGSITAGNAVQVNSNGTASIPTVTINTTTGATATVTTNTGAIDSKIVYCPNVDRYVSLFLRNSDSFLMAALGTPSDDGSISFATPTAITSFNCQSQSLEAVWFPTQSVVLITYGDNGGTGYSRTLTVTTSSITANTQLGSVAFGTIYGLTYDTSANRAVMFWRDGNDGTGKVRALSVSGTTVSMGSAITLNNTNPLVDGNIEYYPDQSKSLLVSRNQNDNNLYGFLITVSGDTCSATGFTNLSSTWRPGVASMTYSSTDQKMIIALADSSLSNSGFAVITVSGATITMGSVTSFSSSNPSFNAVQYDPSINRFVCFYPIVSSGYLGTRTGSVSGTTISFGSETQLYTSQGINNAELSAALDTSRNRIAVQWVAGVNEFARTIQAGTASLTANNFVGFAQNSVSNGQTVTVTVTGGVNSNQTGLTAASRYYLSASGSLSTTSSSINAGIALSATSILVKG